MCISTRGDWTLGGKRARKRRKERGGEQVAMVTIKGADQTRRDEVPPPLLPSTLLHRSHRGPENRFHPTPHHFSSSPLFYPPPLFRPLPERKLFLKLKRHRKIYPFDEFEEMESCSDLFAFPAMGGFPFVRVCTVMMRYTMS